MDGQDEKSVCLCARVGLNVGLVLSSIRYNLSYLSHILICSVLPIFIKVDIKEIWVICHCMCCFSMYLYLCNGKLFKLFMVYMNNLSAKISLWWMLSILSTTLKKIVSFCLNIITKKEWLSLHKTMLYFCLLCKNSLCKLSV